MRHGRTIIGLDFPKKLTNCKPRWMVAGEEHPSSRPSDFRELFVSQQWRSSSTVPFASSLILPSQTAATFQSLECKHCVTRETIPTLLLGAIQLGKHSDRILTVSSTRKSSPSVRPTRSEMFSKLFYFFEINFVSLSVRSHTSERRCVIECLTGPFAEIVYTKFFKYRKFVFPLPLIDRRDSGKQRWSKSVTFVISNWNGHSKFNREIRYSFSLRLERNYKWWNNIRNACFIHLKDLPTDTNRVIWML